jgi:NAD+--dinitrogen-reductase ADP-D-ribosyltransferase
MRGLLAAFDAVAHGEGHDNDAAVCRVNNKTGGEPPAQAPRLPRDAQVPINRCNLPAAVLGSLTFQHHPSPLLIDGVAELYRSLFAVLDTIEAPQARAQRFMDYMAVHFRLEHLDEAGWRAHRPNARPNANYLRMMRGWAFDSSDREGAVLKGWVESRFGLLPRHHVEPLRAQRSGAYWRYLEARAQGLYGTNALEAQLDLLYAYTQYEFGRSRPGERHVALFRGVNRLADHDVLATTSNARPVLLLNNLNSFSASRERAGEFGDHILAVQVPLVKVFFHSGLLPDVLRAESEYAVIGGLYEVDFSAL